MSPCFESPQLNGSSSTREASNPTLLGNAGELDMGVYSVCITGKFLYLAHSLMGSCPNHEQEVCQVANLYITRVADTLVVYV